MHTNEIQNGAIKLSGGTQDLKRVAPGSIGEHGIDENKAQHSLHEFSPAEEDHQGIGDGIAVVILRVLGVQVGIEVGVPGTLQRNIFHQLLSEGNFGNILLGDFVVVDAIASLEQDVHHTREEEPEDEDLLSFGKAGEDHSNEGEDYQGSSSVHGGVVMCLAGTKRNARD